MRGILIQDVLYFSIQVPDIRCTEKSDRESTAKKRRWGRIQKEKIGNFIFSFLIGFLKEKSAIDLGCLAGRLLLKSVSSLTCKHW